MGREFHMEVLGGCQSANMDSNRPISILICQNKYEYAKIE